MDKEIVYKLVLLAKLHDHQIACLNDKSVEIINSVNKILVELISDGEIKIRFNYYEELIETVLTPKTVYSFFEDLLMRDEATKVEQKNNDLITIADWKNDLKKHIDTIQREKSYNQYLKHLRVDSDRFEIEYFDGIIVLRDKDKKMMTNILELKNAVQQCV